MGDGERVQLVVNNDPCGTAIRTNAINAIFGRTRFKTVTT
jgi:hypothetical protein